MSLALARKYRPLTFDDLIGQETISQTLSLALESDRLSHAYLFSGLRGSGKTSTARIFAKALLCEKGVTAHPCGVCSHCVMAVENRHLDIIEMDAASNRGIDDIKDLIEHTKYNPSSARYKIFIIDEVHMLTNQAFNALLKTLEEPPKFVKFILATTDPLKLPATILSRTQHFRFRRIPQELILKHLEHILNLENVGYERDALNIIARSGAGSLRDSLTLTDQAIVYSKNFVDSATVTGMLGIIEPAHLEALLIAILNKEKEKILAFIQKASHYEAEMILDEITLFLKEKLLRLDTTFSPLIIERFFRVIAESKALLVLGSNSEFVLALCFFKMCESLEIQSIDAMIKTLEEELQGVEVKPLTKVEVSSPTTPLVKPIEKREQTAKTEPIVQAPIVEQTPKREPVNQDPIIETVKIQNIQKEEKSIAKETTITPSININTDKTEKIDTYQNDFKRLIKIEPIVQAPIIEQTPKREPVSQDSIVETVKIQNIQKEEKSIAKETTITPSININTDKTEKIDTYQNDFKRLIKIIYDRDFELGTTFEKNIFFESFKENKLSWHSHAQGEDKKMLITYWGIVNMFVKEVFGLETKIVNIPPKNVTQIEEISQIKEENIPQEEPLSFHEPIVPNQAQEESQMKSSCIAPEAGDTESAKEKDPSTLLQEPMIKEAIAIFDPKKVRIKRNS